MPRYISPPVFFFLYIIILLYVKSSLRFDKDISFRPVFILISHRVFYLYCIYIYERTVFVRPLIIRYYHCFSIIHTKKKKKERTYFSTFFPQTPAISIGSCPSLTAMCYNRPRVVCKQDFILFVFFYSILGIGTSI